MKRKVNPPYLRVWAMLDSVKDIEILETLQIQKDISLVFSKGKYIINFCMEKITPYKTPLIRISVHLPEGDFSIIRPAGETHIWEIHHDVSFFDNISEREFDRILSYIKEILDKIIPMLILEEL